MSEIRFTHDDAMKCALNEMERIFDSVPYIREFHRGEVSNEHYYIRHVIEIILRIKLNNEVDAYSLYKLGYRDNLLSKRLATYLSEEYGHEAFFMRDLKAFGLTEEQVNLTVPFFSTKKLIGFLYFSIMQDGAMPTMIWNWLVEWYSDTYNTIITKKAANDFGVDKVSGSLNHLEFDENHGHLDLMYSTIKATIKCSDDVIKAKNYINQFVTLIGEYYQDLYDNTIALDNKEMLKAS